MSGDLLSKVSETFTRIIGGEDDNIVGEDIPHQEMSEDTMVDDDNMSIISDSSFGSEILTLDDVNVAPQHNNPIRRKRRTRVDRLGHPEAHLPRLRPRRQPMWLF